MRFVLRRFSLKARGATRHKRFITWVATLTADAGVLPVINCPSRSTGRALTGFPRKVGVNAFGRTLDRVLNIGLRADRKTLGTKLFLPQVHDSHDHAVSFLPSPNLRFT